MATDHPAPVLGVPDAAPANTPGAAAGAAGPLVDTAARLAAARANPTAAEPAPQPQSRAAGATGAVASAPSTGERASMAPQPTSRAVGAAIDGTAGVPGGATANASVPAPEQAIVNTAGTLQEAMDRGEPLVIRPRPPAVNTPTPSSDAGSTT